MMKRHMWKIIAFVAVALLAASIVYSNYASKQANEGIIIEPNAKGNLESSVTLTEFGDFQCPACAQFHPRIQEIMEKYGDQIRFEYRHFPLISIHPWAIPAAKAAEAAGQQGKFFEMHDKIFENQTIWARSGNPKSYFDTYAEELGLDMDLYNRHYGASLIDERIENDFKEARAIGLTGTPSFLLNGQRMQFESFEDFENQILQALDGGQGDDSAQHGGSEDVRFGI